MMLGPKCYLGTKRANRQQKVSPEGGLVIWCTSPDLAEPLEDCVIRVRMLV